MTDANAIERMKAEILRQAREEAAEILRQAREEAAEILRQAEENARETDERMRREAAPKLKTVRQTILWTSIAENRKTQLAVREEWLSKVFTRVESEIGHWVTATEKEYNELLFSLVKEGAKGIGEHTIRIASNPRDTKYLKTHGKTLRESLKQSLGYTVKVEFAEDAVDCIGGVIISSHDNDLVYVNTLESRILRARDKLRLNVGRILFEEG